MDLMMLLTMANEVASNVASSAADAAQQSDGWFSPTGTFFQACGWIASIGLVLGYVPQAIQTIKTRQTDDIAMPTFMMISLGGIAFMLQGAMLGWEEGWSLFLTNLITVLCSLIIFGIKIYNDYFKKKDKTKDEKKDEPKEQK